MKSLRMLVAIIAVLLSLAVVWAQKPSTPPAPEAPQVKALTKTGQMAFRTVQQELQQVLSDANDIVASECKLQGLDAKEWQLNFQSGMLVKVPQPPKALSEPTGPPVEPAKKDAKPSAPAKPDKTTKPKGEKP